MTGLSDLLVLEWPEGDLVYSVSAAGGGVMVREESQSLRPLDLEYVSAGGGLDAPRQILQSDIAGAQVLLVYGRYGNDIEAYRLADNGTVQSRFSLTMQDSPGALLSVLPVSLSGQDYLLTSSRQSEGLAVWSVSAQGNLQRVAQTAGTAEFLANDVFATEQVTLGGALHVLAISASDNSLTLLRMNSGGTLMQVSRFDPRDGLAIETPMQLKVVSVLGQNYALVGSPGSGSITVVALMDDGGMRVTDQVNDDSDSRFAGLSVLEVLTLNGQVYVAAGGADDGITLMTLLPGGRLLRIGQIADDAVMALGNPQALELVADAGGIGMFVAGAVPAEDSDAGSGLTQLWASVGEIGETRQFGNVSITYTGTSGNDQIIGGQGNDQLRGGAGDDIFLDGAGTDTLWGGAGEDVFVLGADGRTDLIADFERGVDRMDLSSMGLFYTVEALEITSTSTGARLRLGGEELIVQSADGRPLTRADFTIAELRDLWHVAASPLPEVDGLYEGSDQADVLDGRGGNDTLIGGGEGDVLQGQGGDDWLNGESQDAVFDPTAAQVFRLYQATLDREPDFTGLHHWSARLIAQPTSLSEVADGFVGSVEFRTVYGDTGPGVFVTLLYNNVLGREPDSAGLAFWMSSLITGTRTEADVVLGFSESAEFVAATEVDAVRVSHAGLQSGFSDDIFRLYQATLGRNPDVSGFLHWSDLMAGGLSFGAAVSGFVASAEFQRDYGGLSNIGFVSLLYQNVLGRAADPGGLYHWMGQLQSGAASREDVVEAFAQSTEFIAVSADPCRIWMRAAGQGDVLDGGTGTNILFGGVLADQFVFRASDGGYNTVVDLEAWDSLVFEGFGYAGAAGVRAHLQERGGDTLFTDQGVSVVFADISPDQITDWMIFV